MFNGKAFKSPLPFCNKGEQTRPSDGPKNIVMIAYSNYMGDARIRREAEALAGTREYNVTVLGLKNGNKTGSNGSVSVKELRTPKYRGNSLFKYMSSYLKFMFEAFWVCNKMCLAKNIAAFHVHNMPNFLVLSALVPRILGRKLILDIHDSMPETYSAKFGDSKGLLFKLLCLEEAVCCKLAHRIICVNHPQREALVQRGIRGSKIDVSMNVPDPSLFHGNGNPPPEREKKEFQLVYHGTLAKRLGIDVAIRAVDLLRREIPGLEFIILGDGDDQQEFIDLAKELGVGETVRFKGMVPLEDLAPTLKDADVGVISNRKNIATELMLPVKLLEYVSLNIPVVAPRLKTIEYYFSDEMVSYFEPDNVEGLRKAILALYRDRQKREDQARKAKKFLEQYGWEKHRQELIGVYRGLTISERGLRNGDGKKGTMNQVAG